jgi:hypothetical protein
MGVIYSVRRANHRRPKESRRPDDHQRVRDRDDDEHGRAVEDATQERRLEMISGQAPEHLGRSAVEH